MEYIFNIGTELPKQCHGRGVYAIEVLEILGEETDTCEIIGDKEIK